MGGKSVQSLVSLSPQTLFLADSSRCSQNSLLRLSADCSPAGKVCENEGMEKEGETSCKEGYYCRLGAPTDTPEKEHCAGEEGDETACTPGAKCPVGYFCPAGSVAPQPCPAGTTGTTAGATDDKACAQCPQGHYCPSSGGQLPCDEGFVCLGGASTQRPVQTQPDAGAPLSTPSGKICPEGHYCESGATSEKECEEGTYSDVEVSLENKGDNGPSCFRGLIRSQGLEETTAPRARPAKSAQGLGACKPCPAGFICDSTGESNGRVREASRR